MYYIIVKQLKNFIKMKKLILSLVILVMATSLTAQVSVWDGSYEEFDASNGKGLTEDDPILIESAAQLAFMSQRPYSATSGKCIINSQPTSTLTIFLGQQ